MLFQPVPLPHARNSAHVLVPIILHLDHCTSLPVVPSQPNFLPKPHPPPNCPAFLHLSLIPSCLAPLSQDFQETFQTQRPGCLPAIGCLAVIFLSLIRIHHWFVFNLVFLAVVVVFVVSEMCLLSECPSHYWLFVAVAMGTDSFHCLKCQM